ncbi:MAG TPA: hypothetical protein VKA74_05430, partial [Myxococcota bacterium]|nr:hypothetical protein [Myxococcota bacterium]
NALQESVMERARIGFVKTVVALTPNQTLNGVFVGRARERFGVPSGLIAVSDTGGLVSEQVGSGQAEIVFEGPHDVERWDVRGRRGDVGVEHFVRAPEDTEGDASETSGSVPKTAGLSESSVILAVEREAATSPMHSRWRFRPGDRIAVAIHGPEREDALRALAAKGWEPDRRAGEPVPNTEPETGNGGEEEPAETAHA